ncbi:chaplin [Streptomyces sp.]|uniref:chaplin n=1 Tax=Streptomyces sp. TaxID=1931 RepID=UPI002F3E5A63
MRQILSWSVLTVAAASSILAATGGHASADSDARGGAAGSAGALSGNSVQAPVDAPVNVCGNTVDVAAAGNAAIGNTCSNGSRAQDAGSSSQSPGAGAGTGARSAAEPGGQNAAEGSSGVLSGNSVDIPVRAPVNVCGNSADAVGVLNPAMGNSCANVGAGSSATTPQSPPRGTPYTPSDGGGRPPTGPRTDGRTPEAPIAAQVAAPGPAAEPELAETGVHGLQIAAAGATSAALLLGGTMLYRRRSHGGAAAVRIR